MAVASILDFVLTALYWLIIIRALISWVSPDPFNPVVQFLYKTTDPILNPIRKLLPVSLKFGIDLSPIVAFLAIIFLKTFLVNTLNDLAMRIKFG
jgi:YggT family protein